MACRRVSTQRTEQARHATAAAPYPPALHPCHQLLGYQPSIEDQSNPFAPRSTATPMPTKGGTNRSVLDRRLSLQWLNAPMRQKNATP